MTKTRAVRFVALFGATFFAVAYCGFVMTGLNGGGAKVSDLWMTPVFARAHVLLAWVLFATLGVAAFIFRGRLGHRLIVIAMFLVGLPICWAIGLRFFYYNQPAGWWPGFDNEVWRWTVNHIYAEFSMALAIGFLGVVGVTLTLKRATDAT